MILSDLRYTVRYFRPSRGAPKARLHKWRIGGRGVISQRWKSEPVRNVKDLSIAHGISYLNCEI